MAAQISGKRQCVKPAGCIRGLLSFTLLNTRPQSQLVLHWKRSRGTIQKVLRDKGGKEQIKAGALLFTLFLQPLTMGWCQPPSCGSTRTSCSSGAHAPHPRGLTVTIFFLILVLEGKHEGESSSLGLGAACWRAPVLVGATFGASSPGGQRMANSLKMSAKTSLPLALPYQNTKSRPWRTLEIV